MLTILKNRQKYNFSLSSHSFSSSGRTDLQKYSNSPSWSTDSKNVKTIFVGPGVQVQSLIKKRLQRRLQHQTLHLSSNISTKLQNITILEYILKLSIQKSYIGN